jgi:CheY-like chemotaxis protein
MRWERRRSRRPQTIEIADDSSDVRQLWRTWFSLFGFDVVEAATGAEAVTVAAQHPPAVILMDFAMPVLDGIEATHLLKQHPATREVPVVLVTAHASAGLRGAADAAGCAALLPKPTDLDSLLDQVRRVLRRAQR